MPPMNTTTYLGFLGAALLVSLTGCDGSEAEGPGKDTSNVEEGEADDEGGEVGDDCSDGAFGAPEMPCAEGLTCVFESESSAPEGPDGSSSATTGTCQEVGEEGDDCGDGAFGSPEMPCGEGLVCVFE
jgi:hypothetical protein